MALFFLFIENTNHAILNGLDFAAVLILFYFFVLTTM